MQLLFKILTLVLWTGMILNAQDSEHELLRSFDAVFVDLNKQNQVIYYHKVESKQTIYSIAKKFGVSQDDIFKLNNLTSDSIVAVNRTLHIPIRSISISKSIERPSLDHVPVVYVTKEQETLYRIAKVYFDQPIEDLIARNILKGFTLRIDQALIIGWLNPQGNKKTVEEKPAPLPFQETMLADVEQEDKAVFTKILEVERDSSISEYEDMVALDTLEAIKDYTYISTRGIAIWDKKGSDQQNLFVMHKSAKINSDIEIRNPMSNLTVSARVVGHIPDLAYTDDIKMILSPAVAKNLGLIDKRAMVEMRYQKDQ